MSLFEGGRGREFDLSRQSDGNDVTSPSNARQVGGSSEEPPSTSPTLDPTLRANLPPQKSAIDRMAAALDGLLDCLFEFGEEAHKYCQEWSQEAQDALTAYQQSVCVHNPQVVKGFEGKWCVLCGVRIIDNVRVFETMKPRNLEIYPKQSE